MSFLPTRRLTLGLALSLLWPATAFAQTPAGSPTTNPPLVQIRVEFATVSAADLDKSGVAFDRVPLAQPGAFLQYATGNIVAQLFQTLTRTRGKVVQAPVITTTNNVPATIQVNTQAPDGEAGFLSIQTGVTLTPRINSDDSITLNIASQAADTNLGAPATEPLGTILRTIRSGDVIAVAGLPFSPDRTSSDRKLLIFVTPTLVGTDTRRGDAGEPVLLSPPVRNTSPTTGKTVFIDVFNADLHTVVTMLERQFNLKASVQDSDGAYKPVYVHLNGASLSEALGAIARSAGAQIIRDERGVYVFSPLPGSARTPTPAAPADGGSSVTVTP